MSNEHRQIKSMNSDDDKLVAAYERAFVPEDEHITSWFGDYSLWEIKYNTSEQDYFERYDKALEILGMTPEEYHRSDLVRGYTQEITEKLVKADSVGASEVEKSKKVHKQLQR